MKRLVCICLCLLSLTALLPGAAMAENSGFDINLSADTIALFEAVGILEKNDAFTTTESMEVTRGEFARLLVCMLGYRETAAVVVKPAGLYQDVTAGTAYASEIVLATQLGLFGGEVSGYFYPKERARTDWAARAVARLLGYGAQVERSSAVPASLGLLKGVASAGVYLRRDSALKILRNALDAELLQVVGFTGGGLALDSVKDETILTEYFNIYRDEDVMLADAFTAISGQKTQPGYARFGAGLFHTDGLETKNLVGTNLRYYFREDDGERTIVYFEKRKNTEVVLSAKNTEYHYNKNCYTADNGGKTLQFSMELHTKVAYNGKPCFDKALMQPKTGQITLIDNDADGAYEVCIIREFRNLIVKSCNSAEGKIFDALDSGRNLDADAYDQFLLYNGKGEAIELSALKTDQILTVYESADKKCAEAYVSDKGASFELSEINEGEDVLVIDAQSYPLSADSRIAPGSLCVGQYYYFYMNHWNEVVYASANWTYSAFYLMETHAGQGLDPQILLKGLEESGTIEIYRMADKISWHTYDGGREIIKKEEAFARLNTNAGVVNRQLIKIGLDINGRLKEIVTAYEAESLNDVLSMGSDYPLIRMKYIVNEWPEQFKQANNPTKATLYGTGFGNWLHFSKQAVEMYVPLNTTDFSYSDDDVSLRKIRTKTGETRVIAEIDAYMSSKDRISADYLVSELPNSTNASADDGYFMNPYLVTDITAALDEDTGEIVNRLSLCSRGGAVAQYVAKTETILERESLEKEAKTEMAAGDPRRNQAVLPQDKNQIEAGDVVAIELDQSGKIERIRLVYDGKGMRDIHPLKAANTFGGSTSDIIEGKILRLNDSFAEYEASGDAIAEGTKLTGDLTNYLIEYDVRRKTARRITTAELYPEDRVLLYMRYGSYYMAVVYRNV